MGNCTSVVVPPLDERVRELPAGTIVEGYKGFDANMRCLGFQYEIGKTYEIPPDQLWMCHSGFHFCLFPAEVMRYYPSTLYGGGSLYCRVRGEGRIFLQDDKYCCTKITILSPTITFEELEKIQPKIVVSAYDGATRHYDGLKPCNAPDGGPGVVSADGITTKMWVDRVGLPHRDDDDKPAYVTPNEIRYYKHGIETRGGGGDKPSSQVLMLENVWLYTYTDGRGEISRDEKLGPAKLMGPYYIYMLHGRVHRSEQAGPAAFLPGGLLAWVENGQLIRFEKLNEKDPEYREPIPEFSGISITDYVKITRDRPQFSFLSQIFNTSEGTGVKFRNKS
jgi:hypothetical protein